MPFYYTLRTDFLRTEQRNYVAKKLIKLKGQLEAEVPCKDAEHHLLLETWNIRDFGKKNRRGYGNRTKDSLYYIAEIISSFDLVAVQEVNELNEWRKVMSILGPNWDFIATDVADDKAGGNGERMLFVYDKRKVLFRNVAGEIVLPTDMLITEATNTGNLDKLFSGKQFRRTPFVVTFQSDWFKFDLCTVHIYFGADSSEELQQRIQEIDRIAKYLSKRADNALNKQSNATILLGDFNIKNPEHETMKALFNNGFTVPKNIQSKKTNVIETMHYDQIAFKSDEEIISFIDTESNDPKTANSGVVKVLKSVFQDTEEDYNYYEPEVSKSSAGNINKFNNKGGKRAYYAKEWRTYQMSDHNLMWVRIKTNDSVKYLTNL